MTSNYDNWLDDVPDEDDRTEAEIEATNQRDQADQLRLDVVFNTN